MRTTTSSVKTSRGRGRKHSGFAFIVIALGLGSLALPHMAQAVTPAPDGGYPGGNTAEGQNALFSLTTGGFNTAVGYSSLKSNTEGQFNTAIGAGALLTNVGDPSVAHGVQNTATGAGALLSNTTGHNNMANGAFALFSNTAGIGNTASGTGALESNTIGGGNTAIGQAALSDNTTGAFNTAIGTGALLVANGSSNTVVGAGAGQNINTANNVICIGQGVAGADVSDSCYIGNIWNQPGGSQAVYVNSDGKLGAQVSSRRFKEEIKPMDKASEALLSLKPVTFRYKKEIDPSGISQFGLVAEEVEKVNPGLVVRDKEGKPYSVRYDQVNVMLLSEFLKAHRKMEEQQKQIDALTSQLKQQAALIQKVRVQVGLNRPSPQVALDKQ